MRTLLVTLLLLPAPAAAAARPLDPDRGFASNGIFRLDEPHVSSSVVALRGGGTLHATDGGLMRLDAEGRLQGFTPNGATHLAPGLAVGFTYESGEKTMLRAWPLDAAGAPGDERLIELPRSVSPIQVVRRRGGYAVLAWAAGNGGLFLVALTREGELDTAWGKGGYRRVAGDYDDLALAAARDGSLVHASTLKTGCDRHGYRERKERAVLRVQRFNPAGTPGRARRIRVGAKTNCPAAETGEALVDGRGRVLVVGRFGTGVTLLRLKRTLRRDRRFTATVRRDLWGLPTSLARRPGGGAYAVGFTEDDDLTPRGAVLLVDRRGRRVALRRLKVTRSHPTSDLQDIAFDRGRRLIAAGSLRDTDIFIREDFGVPHLAVWGLRTTR